MYKEFLVRLLIGQHMETKIYAPSRPNSYPSCLSLAVRGKVITCSDVPAWTLGGHAEEWYIFPDNPCSTEVYKLRTMQFRTSSC